MEKFIKNAKCDEEITFKKRVNGRFKILHKIRIINDCWDSKTPYIHYQGINGEKFGKYSRTKILNRLRELIT